MALINQDRTTKRWTDLESQEIEAIWLEICPFKSKRSTILGSIYRSPSSNKADDMSIESNIQIVSDINIDFRDKLAYGKYRLAKGLRNLHFKQLVDFITRPVSKACLYHVYCNQPQRIKLVTSHNIGLADHLPIFVVREYARLNCKKSASRIRYRDMKRFDKDQFKLSLHRAPWDIAFVFDDIDDVVYAWEDTFNNILDIHCPWREKCVKRPLSQQSL